MLKKNIAVFISGNGTNLQAIIDSMDEINGEIKLVASNVEGAYGLKRAEEVGIDSIYIDNCIKTYNRRLLEECNIRKIDLIVLAGYLKILDQGIIDKYRNRIVNIHPSLLPSFGGKGCYGDEVHRQVYERGVKVTGATVHFVDEGTDTGPIILQEVIDVKDNYNISDIQEKVLELEHEILPRAIKLFCEDRLEVEEGKVKIL